MTSEVDRLLELLEQKDNQIESLKSRIETLEFDLDSTESGWCLPRYTEEDLYPELPLPRLQFEIFNIHKWYVYTVEYALIYRHFDGSITTKPLGKTKISGLDKNPFEHYKSVEHLLPIRDGSNAIHDSAHFKLPLYFITPKGPVEIKPEETHQYAFIKGKGHSR